MKTFRFVFLWALLPLLASASEKLNGGWDYRCQSIRDNTEGDLTPHPAQNEFSRYTVVKSGSKRTVSWLSNLGSWDAAAKEARGPEQTATGNTWKWSFGGTKLTYFESSSPEDQEPGFTLSYPLRDKPGSREIAQFNWDGVIKVDVTDGKATVVETCGGAMQIKLGQDITDQLKTGDLLRH